MKFGYVFELLNVFKDKLIGNCDWFHDLFLHLLLSIVRSHYGFQILWLWLFRELVLTIIDDGQDINIGTDPLMIPTNPDNTPTNNILKQHRKIFSSRFQKQRLFFKIKCQNTLKILFPFISIFIIWTYYLSLIITIIFF